MLSQIKRYRDLILVALLLVFPFATFMARGPRGRDPMLVDRALLSLSSYVQRAFTWMLDGGTSLWSSYAALRSVEVQNRSLREEIRALRIHAQEQGDLAAENEQLRELLEYHKQAPGPKIFARVVGVDPSSTRHFVRIDRGEKNGVSSGMAVITIDGVAGYVERATAGWADVILITDATHRMGVRVERSRARAIAAGTGDKQNLELRLDFALRKDALQDSDVMVTSGADGIYPAGLRVGTLVGVQKKATGMFQEAKIKPAVDPSTLEEVMVLPRVPHGPPPAPAAPPALQGGPGAGGPGTGGAGVP